MSALWQGRSVTADPEAQANAVARGSRGSACFFFIADKLGEYVLFWLATWLVLTSRAKAQVCIGPTPFPKSVDAKERVSTCWDWPAPGFS